MDIQVWSDVLCPWCYIGKRRLETALAELPAAVTVTYRAYQLDPAPVRPEPLLTALAAKFGGSAQAAQMAAHVTAVAAGDGLTLNFDRAIAANSFDAHRLIAWAARTGRQAQLLDALHRAHFTDGLDIGSRDVLAQVAGSIGLDTELARRYLDTRDGAAHVEADEVAARTLGISSVPTFVVNDRYAIQGAQEPTAIRDALTEIARRESAGST